MSDTARSIEIEQQIRATRDELGQTVEELARRLDPRQQAVKLGERATAMLSRIRQRAGSERRTIGIAASAVLGAAVIIRRVRARR